ncbi:unnamed protein product [Clavelina lepadiformis]|uniref:Knr4/Smi1-like domain-containing protein n=1 Tax=Clavelina lepadiformis TaxID=159417 RepID=A0ABP0EZ92_CLALP
MANITSHDLIERLTLGVATTLEKRPGICDVSLSNFAPAERHKIIAWEQRNTCMLPEDLKNFYLTTNGLLLTWKVNVNETSYPLGRMEVNSIEDLTKISITASTSSMSNNISLADVDYNSDSDDNEYSSEHSPPHFDGRSRIFELDPCNGFGKVCLVYLKATPGLPAQSTEIWFLDRSLTWSFLAANFSTYYRLMLMHVGLPQWQYAFTEVGLNPKAKEWFNLYAPVRLHLDEDIPDSEDNCSNTKSETSSSKVDFGRVFKGKTNEKIPKVKSQASTGLLANKKKPPAGQSITGSKSLTALRHGRGSKPWT